MLGVCCSLARDLHNLRHRTTKRLLVQPTSPIYEDRRYTSQHRVHSLPAARPGILGTLPFSHPRSAYIGTAAQIWRKGRLIATLHGWAILIWVNLPLLKAAISQAEMTRPSPNHSKVVHWLIRRYRCEGQIEFRYRMQRCYRDPVFGAAVPNLPQETGSGVYEAVGGSAGLYKHIMGAG